ncbi:MAG: methionine synthase [Prevotella sp.]|nr:methionine synthase [Prevotella sp.]
MNIHELSFNDLHISPSEIYSQMDYGDAVPDNKVVTEMVEILKRIKEILRSKFCFVIADGMLDKEKDTLTVKELDRKFLDRGAWDFLDESTQSFQSGNEQDFQDKSFSAIKETTFDIGKIIARQLRDSSAFAFFIATAGMEFQHFLEELKQENDMVKLFIADAIGSVIAEKTADCMEEELQKHIDIYSWKHTNRFSPGYCGWHVSQQQLLFPLFGSEAPCGVTLTESSLMYPIKSVSGVIGIGATVCKFPYSCGLCDMKTCRFRHFWR